MWENSSGEKGGCGGDFYKTTAISSTGQSLVLMKLRWGCSKASPRAPPAMLPSAMTMRVPQSLTERCHFKEKLKKVNRIVLQWSS